MLPNMPEPATASPDAAAWLQKPCRPRDDVTVTDLGDQLVLLDPRNQEMYALDRVGRFIWQALPTERLADVASAVVERYAIDPARVAVDLHDLVAELQSVGVLPVGEGAEPAG